jgi:hypothetical protein
MKTLEILAFVVIISGLVLAAIFGARIITANMAADTGSGEIDPIVEEKPTNIRAANPTPTSCTSTQNCGQESCAASRGGSCGCGG